MQINLGSCHWRRRSLVILTVLIIVLMAFCVFLSKKIGKSVIYCILCIAIFFYTPLNLLEIFLEFTVLHIDDFTVRMYIDIINISPGNFSGRTTQLLQILSTSATPCC